MEKEGKLRAFAELSSSQTVENPKGVFRTTLAYNKQIMVCHFRMQKGVRIPLHHHQAAQNGFVIRGRVRFEKGNGESFIAEAGCGYVFNSEEVHGAEILEEAEVLDCFSPMRPEYI